MKNARIAILCCGAIASVGCMSNAGKSDTEVADERAAAEAAEAAMDSVGLIPQTHPPIRDLPVPIGFKLIDEISRHDQSPERRVIDHIYQGRDEPVDVKRFYTMQMPLKDWEQTHARYAAGQHMLRFIKQGHAATINISDKLTFAGRRTTIHIEVNPRTAPPANGQ